MDRHEAEIMQTADTEWVAFPGGELEGRPPRVLCRECRERLKRDAALRRRAPGGVGRRQALCFQCYRTELDRARALEAAGQRETASEARFQTSLPFEPVNRARLAVLKVERAAARVVSHSGDGRFTGRLRLAQIAARHALRMATARLDPREAASGHQGRPSDAAIHAAELQLPESWLPFVVSG